MKENDPFDIIIKKNKLFKEDPVCHIYSNKDFHRYIECKMNEAEVHKFEAHYKDCLACGKTLLKLIREETALCQKEEMDFYFNKTMAYLDEIDAKRRHKTNK